MTSLMFRLYEKNSVNVLGSSYKYHTLVSADIFIFFPVLRSLTVHISCLKKKQLFINTQTFDMKRFCLVQMQISKVQMSV